MDLEQSVRERLTAFIYPVVPRSKNQTYAFEEAVQVQYEYESRNESFSIPDGVASFSIGDFSAKMMNDSHSAAYTQATISPHAWAILKNAGLLRSGIPTARRI